MIAVGAGADVGGRLAAGAAVAPEEPARGGRCGCRRWSGPRSRRSPTRAGRRAARRGRRGRRARRSRGRGRAGCRGRGGSRRRRAGSRSARASRLALGRQRQVGAAGVAQRPAPLGLAVAGEPDDGPVRAGRARGRRRDGVAHDELREPFLGRGGLGVEAGRDPAGVAGRPAGGDGVAHRGGHQLRVGGAGDGARQEDAGAAELHRQGGVGRGADAGVEDHGHLRQPRR